MQKFLPLMALVLVLWCAPALAEDAFFPPAHGIAMHGVPKYGAGFSHFDYVNPSAPKGGSLRLGVVGTFDSLNPFIVRGTTPQAPAFSLFSSAAVYETLMARSWDEPFSLYGLIAQSIQVAKDRSSVLFTLRPEAHWQDGVQITPDDILFSFQTLRDHGRPNHRLYYKKVARAEKVGEHGVRFDFKRNPDGTIDREMPLIMGLMPLLPAHVWQGKNFNQTTLNLPVASGPYKVVAVDPGRSVTLKRDPNYWGRGLAPQKGMYNFDEIKIDYYRDDSVALQAFRAGAFDLRRELDPKKWVKLAEDPSVKEGRLIAARFPHARPEAFAGFIFNTRRSPLNSLALRAAAELAFDFDWINKALLYGFAKRTQSIFPNAELAANDLPKGPENQRERLLRAAETLRKAGYVLQEGKLFAPDGKAVSFEVMLSDPGEEKIALEWARNLRRLGIDARVRTVDSAQYQARLNGFDYDVTTGRWFNSLSPGNEQMNYWSCASSKQNGSRNYPGVCDVDIDRLAAAIPSAETREELVSAARALDRALIAGHYVVPFYYLGVDPVAYWGARVNHPTQTPIYGPILESWWSATLN